MRILEQICLADLHMGASLMIYYRLRLGWIYPGTTSYWPILWILQDAGIRRLHRSTLDNRALFGDSAPGNRTMYASPPRPSCSIITCSRPSMHSNCCHLLERCLGRSHIACLWPRRFQRRCIQESRLSFILVTSSLVPLMQHAISAMARLKRKDG